MPAEDLDDPVLTKPENQSIRYLTPFPEKYKHLTDSFDKGSIYAACQSAFTRKIHGENVHCFYFGFKGPAEDIKIWQSPIRKKLNRILLLEEMLYSAKIMYSLKSITLTTLFLVKRRLISKEHMKQLYKDPKDPQLRFNSNLHIERLFNDPRNAYKQLPREYSETLYFDVSLHDDLDSIVRMIRKFNGDQIEVDQKCIFYLPKLTSSEIRQLNRRDINFSKTFYCFPNDDYDVSIEDMMTSNSKSKFELWDGLRTTLTIPSDDYPLLTTYPDGNFILPLCEEVLFDPVYKYIDIDEFPDEGLNSLGISFMNLDQDDINFESNYISKNQIEQYIEMSVIRYFFLEIIPYNYKYPYLEKYENKLRTIKERGRCCVYIGEEYVKNCSIISECSPYLPIDPEKKFLTLSFHS